MPCNAHAPVGDLRHVWRRMGVSEMGEVVAQQLVEHALLGVGADLVADTGEHHRLCVIGHTAHDKDGDCRHAQHGDARSSAGNTFH